MDALLTSTVTVALAEIGDKTQLLTLLLAAKFRNKFALISGILIATLINHGVSAWLGSELIELIPKQLATWLVAASFILVGLWLLIPDKDEDTSSRFDKYGAFAATFILFFLAEIGDKTQIATVLLGAEYGSIGWVTFGTTLGMLLANVPVVYIGQKVMTALPVDWVHRVAAALFIALGITSIIW